jgi:hypothetical protein
MLPSELHSIKTGGPAVERRKSCEQCGKEFSCYTSDCWCNDLPNIVPLDMERGCLCPECLKTLIDKKTEEYNRNL